MLYKVSILLPFGGDFTAPSSSINFNFNFTSVQGAAIAVGGGILSVGGEVVQRLDNNKMLKVSDIRRVGKCWPDLGPD